MFGDLGKPVSLADVIITAARSEVRRARLENLRLFIGQALTGLCAHHGADDNGLSDRSLARAAYAIGAETFKMYERGAAITLEGEKKG